MNASSKMPGSARDPTATEALRNRGAGQPRRTTMMCAIPPRPQPRGLVTPCTAAAATAASRAVPPWAKIRSPVSAASGSGHAMAPPRIVSLLVEPEARIENVPQLVADYVHTQQRGAKHDARQHADPPVALQIPPRRLEHAAPFGRRRLRAEPKKAQRRARQDGGAVSQGGQDENDVPDVRQQMPPYDPRTGSAGSA